MDRGTAAASQHDIDAAGAEGRDNAAVEAGHVALSASTAPTTAVLATDLRSDEAEATVRGAMIAALQRAESKMLPDDFAPTARAIHVQRPANTLTD